MLTYNGKVLRYGAVGSGMWPSLHVAPPAPLVPSNTIRFTFTDTSFDPSAVLTQTYGTWSNVSPGVWDWYKDANWVNYYDNPFAGKLTPSVIGEDNMVTAYANAGPYNNMEYLFYGCTSLTSATIVNENDGGSYGSERYNLEGVFYNCTALETVSFDGFDFTYVKRNGLDFLFSNCTSLTAGPTMANTGNLTSARNTYRGCLAMESVALFDTSNVTDFANTFAGCSSLTTIPLFDTSSALYLSNFMAGCSSITELPLFDTSNVVSFTSAFGGCAIVESPLFDTSEAQYVDSMYNGCASLVTLPNLDLSKVVSANYFAYWCKSLTSVPHYSMPNVTSVDYMFAFCDNVESGALSLYESLSGQANPPSYHSACFRDCGKDTVTGAAELALIPNDWKYDWH